MNGNETGDFDDPDLDLGMDDLSFGDIDPEIDLLVDNIKQQKCILVLGPGMLLGDVSIAGKVKAFLEKNKREFIFYQEDELFMFSDPRVAPYSYYAAAKLYGQLKPNDLAGKIAEIPFHLIISVSPDTILPGVFQEKGFDCFFDYYWREQNPLEPDEPTVECPLIYNLAGSMENPNSLILTYDDLFGFMDSIFGKHELPKNIRNALKNAESVIFVGFQFQKWYYKVVLRLLGLHTKRNHASLMTAKVITSEQNFYANEFKFEFHDEKLINMVYDKCVRENILRLKTDVSFGKKHRKKRGEVFISYAWGGESEIVAEQIHTVLNDNGFKVIRDKSNLGYKGNIREFMDRIGREKYVVTVIGDKYLKSENCMYEMMEIRKNGDIYERVFPVVMSSARIHDENDRIDYLKYWDRKVEELKEKIGTISNPDGKIKVYEKINEYNEMGRIIDEITDMLRNMNTLTIDLLREKSFMPLIEAIAKKEEED